MDRSDAENEKTSINELREAAESARYAAERLDELFEELAKHLEALSNAAENSMALKLFGLSPEQIKEFTVKSAMPDGAGAKMIKSLDDFLDKTEDYEDIIDKQIDEDS